MLRSPVPSSKMRRPIRDLLKSFKSKRLWQGSVLGVFGPCRDCPHVLEIPFVANAEARERNEPSSSPRRPTPEMVRPGRARDIAERKRGVALTEAEAAPSCAAACIDSRRLRCR